MKLNLRQTLATRVSVPRAVVELADSAMMLPGRTIDAAVARGAFDVGRRAASRFRSLQTTMSQTIAKKAVPVPTMFLLSAAGSLTRRELVRFFRQRSRIIGALVQPLMFWVLFGTGLGGSFRMPGVAESAADQVGYMAYFVPGVAAMIVLFTAIFSTISIIEDRDAGFLQGVLASPSSRLAIVMGKIGGGAVIAILQAALFLVLAPVLSALGVTPDLGFEFSASRVVGLTLFVMLLSVALTALGYCIAWPSRSTQGYHAIMSVFLFPMWLLSGAFFPAAGAGWLKYIIMANPLAYGVAGLRRLLFPVDSIPASMPSMSVCVLVTAVFAVVCVGLGVWLTQRPGSSG